MSYGSLSKGSANGSDVRRESQPSVDHGASSPASETNGVREPGESSAETSNSVWQRTKAFYYDNIGLFFVVLAQILASVMAMTTRLLETGFDIKFHALQIIFVRMIVTASIGSFYLWRKKVPYFPLGPPGVRWLLVIRGLAGTIGLFGLYYSLSFLDIADATVITFLVPTLTGFVCWVALREPFTLREAIAGVIALSGVLFIARPAFLLALLPSRHRKPHDSPDQQGSVHVDGGIFDPVPATPAERSVAVICAVIGSFSAATAYATIRIIGKRVHSLVSVNYFAIMATVTSTLVLLIHPDIGFKMPQNTPQWLLLCSIGLSGFLLQVLLTEGLQRERAGRATNMIYTQLVSALILERIVWDTTPPLESFIGSALIIGAAIWVGLQKKEQEAPKNSQVPDEERRLLDENEES